MAMTEKENENVEAAKKESAQPETGSNELFASIAASELETLRKKAAGHDEMAERFARAAADYQNLRKRMERDIASRSEDLVMDLVQGLMLVLDHLDLAMRSGESATGPLAEGVKLIRAEIETLLGKQGVQPIPAQGLPFDPKFHEVVIQEARAGAKPGTIIEELRRGFRWRERVLRPSQVKVAAAASETEKKNEETKPA